VCCCGAVCLDLKLWLVLLHLVSRRWIQVRPDLDAMAVGGDLGGAGRLCFAVYVVFGRGGCVWTVK